MLRLCAVMTHAIAVYDTPISVSFSPDLNIFPTACSRRRVSDCRGSADAGGARQRAYDIYRNQGRRMSLPGDAAVFHVVVERLSRRGRDDPRYRYSSIHIPVIRVLVLHFFSAVGCFGTRCPPVIHAPVIHVYEHVSHVFPIVDTIRLASR